MRVALPIAAPEALDAAVGYDGDRACYGLFWAQEPGGPETAGEWTVRISDGYHERRGNLAGWLTFIRHPLVAPHLARHGFRTGEDAPPAILVVERDTRALLIFDFGAGLAFLAEQNAPEVDFDGDEAASLGEEYYPDEAGPWATVPLPGTPAPQPSGLDAYFGEPPEHRDPLDALREELDRLG